MDFQHIQNALFILFLLLGILAACCALFTVYNMRCRKRKQRIDTRLVMATYLATAVVLICTVFGVICYFSCL